MDKGIYTALSGGIAKSHELELIANNLANANTPGFKRDTGTFNEYLTELRRQESLEAPQSSDVSLDARPQGDKSFVEMDGIYTDYRQGTIQNTGRSLDVALEGNGFFEVLTPSGIRYTRQGNMNVLPDGRLVTANGFPVLAKPQPGDEARPPEERVIRLGQGQVRISPDGLLFQGTRQVANLSVQEFKEPQWLEKVGNAYFRNVHPDNGLKGPVKTQLHQGFLESSNVNAVQEMTRLIEATRAYESHMQAVKTFQEIDARSVGDIAGNR